jgi:O-Antigen ligase
VARALASRFPTVNSDADAPPHTEAEGREHRTSGPLDVLVLAWPVLMCLAYGGTLLVYSSYTPRMALLLAAGVPGIIALVDLGRRGDVSARLGLALVAWVVVAGFFSGAPELALKGTVGREASGMITIGVIGCWAIARRASSTIIGRLPPVVLGALTVNALVGVIQVLLQVEAGSFALQFGRATGLTPSPVFFGALAAAGAALAAGNEGWRLASRVALVATFGFAAELSGSRVAILATLIAVVVASVTHENRYSRMQRAVLPASALVGILLASALSRVAFDVRSSTGRLGSESGTDGRFQAWRYGLEAVLDRPLAGWGMGRFRAATQGRYSAEFVRSAASDDVRQAWFDGHNVVINTAVGIGLVGLAIALLFVSSSARTARGPMALAAAAIAGITLLQPAGLAILPLALFLLGASQVDERPMHLPRTPPLRYLLALLLGTMLAAWPVLGDLALRGAIDERDAGAVERAAWWYPHDSVVADLVAQAWFVRALDDPIARNTVIEWSDRAVSYESDRPYFWSRYAGRLYAFGMKDASRAAFERGLELEPWHTQSWIVARSWAERYSDDDLLTESTKRLCELDALREGLCPSRDEPHAAP